MCLISKIDFSVPESINVIVIRFKPQTTVLQLARSPTSNHDYRPTTVILYYFFIYSIKSLEMGLKCMLNTSF